MAVEIRIQRGVALRGFNRVCLLYFVQTYSGLYRQPGLSRCLERIVLDHYAVCFGERHSQKFYTGEQGPAAVLLFHSQPAGHHFVQDHL